MAYQIQPYTLGSFRGDRRRTDRQTDRRHSETYIILICRVGEPTPSGFEFLGCCSNVLVDVNMLSATFTVLSTFLLFFSSSQAAAKKGLLLLGEYSKTRPCLMAAARPFPLCANHILSFVFLIVCNRARGPACEPTVYLLFIFRLLCSFEML